MRSGGPKTRQGKAVVSRNAVRHGLRSASPVVAALETEDEWLAYLAGIEESVAPVGDLERALAERVALLLWRLRRVTLFETERMVQEVERVADDWRLVEEYRTERPEEGRGISEPERVGYMRQQTARRVLPKGEVLERVLRYETHLHRQLVQTMHELEALQARRRGEVTPLARLDAVL